MTLPKTARINNHTYAIEEVEGLKYGDIELLGHSDNVDLKLRVEKNQAATIKAQTLVHEAIHSIIDATHFRNVEFNEDLVVALTAPFTAFLADNAEFIRYVQRTFNKESKKNGLPTVRSKRHIVETVPNSDDKKPRVPRRKRSAVSTSDKHK